MFLGLIQEQGRCDKKKYFSEIKLKMDCHRGGLNRFKATKNNGLPE